MAVTSTSSGETVVRNRRCARCGHLNAPTYLACQNCDYILSGSEWVETVVPQQLSDETKPSIHDIPTAVLKDGRKARLEAARADAQREQQMAQPRHSTDSPERSASFFHNRNTGKLQPENNTVDHPMPEEHSQILVGPTEPVTRRTTLETRAIRPIRNKVKSGTPVFSPGMVLYLAVDGEMSPIILHPTASKRLTIGRTEENSSGTPDIDLTSYNGFQRGLSRKHASLELIGKCLMLTDLGSSNGTYMNDTRLDPGEPMQLRDGDTIRLGHMKVKITFRE